MIDQKSLKLFFNEYLEIIHTLNSIYDSHIETICVAAVESVNYCYVLFNPMNTEKTQYWQTYVHDLSNNNKEEFLQFFVEIQKHSLQYFHKITKSMFTGYYMRSDLCIIFKSSITWQHRVSHTTGSHTIGSAIPQGQRRTYCHLDFINWPLS